MKKRNNTTDLYIFGERLKRSLKENKIKVKDLAAYLHYSEDQISNYCRGLNFPDIEILKKIVLFFREKNIDISLDYLCGLEEEKTHDLAFICQETGLTEEAVNAIISNKKLAFYSKYLSAIIAQNSSDSPIFDIVYLCAEAVKHSKKAFDMQEEIQDYCYNPQYFVCIDDATSFFINDDEFNKLLEARDINTDICRLNIRDAAAEFENLLKEIIKYPED